MKGDLMIVLDNSMYSINRERGERTRLDAQIEAVKNITESYLRDSSESTVGVMTLGRSATVKMISPTNNKNTIYSYLHSIKRDENIQGCDGIEMARMSLKYARNKNQKILLFLGSPLEDDVLMMLIEKTEEILNSNVFVSFVLFGEAVEYYSLIKSGVEACPEFTCVKIERSEPFMDGVSTALREQLEEIDPELEMAIKRSLQDVSGQEDPHMQKTAGG